ncbi:hypothetical protein Tco_1277785, partial [Tanacetum coccineum]
IYLVVSQAVLMQLPSQRPRLRIMVISNGLKIWSPTQSRVKESAHDVYPKCRIIVVTKLQIVEWHGYKHLDWITVHRDDDNLYTFKEGDFKRLRLQDIENMLILLAQGKLTNLNVEDRLAFGVSNKDKKNKLMRIDELHKFSDGTLDDVQTALNDHLKGIRMEYLPQIIWRESDRERAKAMIQAIDKQLKSRRIMRSLERFVGGRLYGGKFRLLKGPYDVLIITGQTLYVINNL